MDTRQIRKWCLAVLIPAAVMLSLVPSDAWARTDQLGMIYWKNAAVGDVYGRIYPVNYETRLTNTSGSRFRFSSTNNWGNWDSDAEVEAGMRGTSSNQGVTFIYQINAASGTSTAYPPTKAGFTAFCATPVVTMPFNLAGFDDMTVQVFTCNAVTSSATPGSNSAGTMSPALGPIYNMVGSCSSSIVPRGTAFPETDHVMYSQRPMPSPAGSSTNLTDVARTAWSFMMAPIPDKTWQAGRHAMWSAPIPRPTTGDVSWQADRALQYTSGAIEPASYPITRCGIYHYDVSGLTWGDILVEGNSATQCIVVRLNRRFERLGP